MTNHGNHQTGALLISMLILLLPACGRSAQPGIESLPEGRPLAEYRLSSLAGERDGDRLEARIVFAGPRGNLEMNLRFRVGVPTRLEQGHFRWSGDGATLQGDVAEKTVTFLGGQSDRPALGGVFDLLSPGGLARFRVTVPTTPLDRLASGQAVPPAR
ncbi:MAG: hypothetical protein WAO20_11690 [Acidobacteriota bacterium]